MIRVVILPWISSLNHTTAGSHRSAAVALSTRERKGDFSRDWWGNTTRLDDAWVCWGGETGVRWHKKMISAYLFALTVNSPVKFNLTAGDCCILTAETWIQVNCSQASARMPREGREGKWSSLSASSAWERECVRATTRSGAGCMCRYQPASPRPAARCWALTWVVFIFFSFSQHQTNANKSWKVLSSTFQIVPLLFKVFFCHFF